MHGVLHVGWVPDGEGGHRGQMAVLVKPNGRKGSVYMARDQAVPARARLPDDAARHRAVLAGTRPRARGGVASGSMDFKLELIAIPVSDVDRAKDFYVRAGFNADHDHRVSENLRFVQLTPRRVGVLDLHRRRRHARRARAR